MPPAAPIRLDHANPALARLTVIDWTLGNACNYACSYCPPRLHDASVPWPDADRVLAFCDRLIAHYAALGRDLLFQFSGGEPTVYPHFLRLIEHLHRRDCKVGVISNASRTIRFWEQARRHLDQAVLTHHVEFVDLEQFVAVARFLGQSIRTHVNVTMHPERFDACLANANRIAAECDDVTITLKPLLIGFGRETYAYTDAQRAVIAGTRFAPRLSRGLAESRGPMRVAYDDGHAEVRKPSELIVTGQNRFVGWDCHIGLELLAIDFHGRIFRGLCRQGGQLGHIDDATLRLPVGAVTCTRGSCHCATDLMTTRHAPAPAR
jgi:organic radical activating enzyme